MTNASLDTDITELNRDDFTNLFDAYLEERSISEHSVVLGKVLQVDGNWVVVDVGYKAEGVIPRQEFADADGNVTIDVGDEIDVYLGTMREKEGNLVLSKRKADEMKAWEDISKAVDADEVVKGIILARVK
ncbi:MAG: S1 RNA-binding domain-containing protein, partial [Myxococcota bacterium]|nr:S1 RNA-binding domain-containing protein [Myxococcota bacterium]